MKIKRMVAALMAGMLMVGTFSTTCLAATPETEANKTGTEEVQSAIDTTTPDSAAGAEETGEEPLPYEVNVNEDGNYTFSFGDWEWSTDSGTDSGTDARVSSKVNSYLNLRSGSGMEYEIIGHLLPGEEVQVISEDGDWYQIVVPERTGYVYKDYVDKLKAEEESGNIDEEFLAMMLYLMMSSMNQTNTAPLTPNGNLTLVDDIGSSSGQGQQFITLVTKAGNYFYLIIDRNEKGEENVHFLNMVDEADLFALMDEDQVAAYQAAQDAAKAEEEKPAVTTLTTPEDEKQEAEPKPEVKEKKSVNMLPLMCIIVILAACGGGYFFMQTKKKKASAPKPDPDADYMEDDEEEEFEIPEEKDDEDIISVDEIDVPEDEE